jgi:hypothetical protein
MTIWEQIRYRIARLVWPEMVQAASETQRKIEELEGRLKATHTRMQDLYWEEKARQAALGMIELLQEEIYRLDPENELLKKIRAAAAGGV